MKYIPSWIRKFSLEVINDLLLVTLVALVFLGAGSLMDLNAKDLLSDFTPLLLGLFGIAITITSLKVTIKEGRDRAIRERDDAVRPILVMGDYESKLKQVGFFQCYVSSSVSNYNFELNIENVGLGTALNVEFLILTETTEFYRVVPAVHKLMPDEACNVIFSLSLSKKLSKIFSSYEDVYGNVHYCCHDIVFDDEDHYTVFSNFYIHQEEEEIVSLLEVAEDGPIWTQADRFDEEIKDSEFEGLAEKG